MRSKVRSAACMIVLKWFWFWCFPECVFGETCFFHDYNFCFDVDPIARWLVCILVALEWCDINHIF
ncbi:unnamed protein product [Spirodela intermedia]|uniref:Secreted protein n=1 Tax=Spirodela intermedia TaxID=51605 RepID=A0ABN7EC76_SPIIN|nr:unnamed protein product [Spirodela intermedia]